MDAKTRINKRRRSTENGNYVTRSEIRGRSNVGQKSVINFRNMGGIASKNIDGGRSIVLTKTPAYTASLFYLAPKSSIGLKEILTGNRTVVVNTGLLFVSIDKKGPGRGGKYKRVSTQCAAGQVIELKKGQRYTYSTGTGDAELFIIESGDLSQDTIEESLSNLSGAAQYHLARDPGTDISELKTRVPKTREEREALGQAYAAARGHMTSKEKRTLATEIVRGKREDPATAIVGVNPTPIGDAEIEQAIGE